MNPQAVLKRLDGRIGSPLAMLQRTLQLRARRSRFERDRESRRARYDRVRLAVQDQNAVVRRLDEDGYSVVRGAVDPRRLAAVRDEMEHWLDTGTTLNPMARDSVRVAGDLGEPREFLTTDEAARGQEFYRDLTCFAAINDPLLRCPSIVDVAFDDLLIDIAAGYLDCFPAMTGLNLRKSFVNDLPEVDTLHFHSDPNSARFVKFFLYLNDVDEDGGPFTYVRGSHRRKFRGWMRKYRWTLDEMRATYGPDQIVQLTGKVGDLLMADTTGFHRGTKVRVRDRSMLTIDYLIHAEFNGAGPRFRIPGADHRRLTDKQRAAADLLEVVE